MSVLAPTLEAQHQHLDAIERRMLDEFQVVEMPVGHLFTPGLYRRTIMMPPDSLLTSKIHKTEHPFAVMRGCALVLVLGEEPVLLKAGHQGVTHPGTRRALFIPADSEPCVWSTFHPLSPEEEEMRQSGAGDEELVAAIEARIIEPHSVELHQEYLQMLAAKKMLEDESCPG